MGCAALWLLRWGNLNHPAAYGALLLIAGVAAIWMLRNQKTLWLLAGMLMLDAIGLLAGMSSWGLAHGLHAVLCSLTLPGLMMAICLDRK